MSKSAHLRLADLRAVYELVQECRDRGDDPTAWRVHWFERLGRLCGADLVVGGDAAIQPDGRVLSVQPVGWGWENGFDPSVVRAAHAAENDVTRSPHIAAYFRRPAGADGAGLTRADLVSDGEWYPSAYFGEIHRALGADHTLLSFLALPGRAGECSVLTLARGADSRRDFDRRHRAIAAEAQRLVAPLVGGPLARFAEPSPAALPPRVRQALACLLDGDSDKQAAARLGIGLHTVNQYVKVIFAHFDVTTRTELLARWVKRGWGRGGWAH